MERKLISEGEFYSSPHAPDNPHHAEAKEIMQHVDNMSAHLSILSTKRAQDLVQGHIDEARGELAKASTDAMNYDERAKAAEQLDRKTTPAPKGSAHTLYR